MKINLFYKVIIWCNVNVYDDYAKERSKACNLSKERYIMPYGQFYWYSTSEEGSILSLVAQEVACESLV